MKIITSILLLISSFSIVVAQNITGTVSDNNGNGIPGVNILIKGTNKGSQTDFNGNFKINNVTGDQTLIVSSIGYKTKEVSITKFNNNISIILFEGNELLQEVIIEGRNNSFNRKKTAYVSKLPLKDIENSTVYSTITNEILDSQLVTNLDDAINNATGVYQLWESTGRGASRLGGGTSIYSSRGFVVQPKLVDGVPGFVFGTVDPSYIERIEVLKGPSATLFGSTETSLGGLINVVTKKPFKGEGGSISYTMGSFGLHRGTIDYNTPVGNGDNIFTRINATYLTQDSFQDAGFKESFFVAPSVTFKANDRLNISLGVELSKTKQTNPSIIFMRTGPLLTKNVNELGLDPNKSFTSNDIFLTNFVYNTRLIGDYKISDQWNSKTIFSGTYSNAEGDYQYLFDGGSRAILSLKALSQPLTNGITKAKAGIKQLLAIGANQTTSPYYQKYKETLGALNVLNSTNSSLDFILNDASNLLSKTSIIRAFSKIDDNNTKFNIQQNFTGDFKLGELRNRMVIGLDYLNNQNVIRSKRGNSVILNSSQFPQLLRGLQLLGQTKAIEGIKSNFESVAYFDAVLSSTGELLSNSLVSDGTYAPNKNKLDAAYNDIKPSYKKLSSQVLSTYVSDVINVTPNLIVNLGLRLDHFIQDGDNSTSLDDYNKTTLSPSAGVLFQPIKDKLSVFANYQTGYVNQDPKINLNNNKVITYDPTKAKQFEGGIKTNLFNGRLNLGASYYNIIAEQYLVNDINTTSFFSVKTGINEVVSKGFEFELNTNPFKGLNIRASYALNNMKHTDAYSKKLDKKITAIEGRRPISAGAEKIYNFWADYQFPEETFAKNFGLGFGFNGTSEHLPVNNAISGQFTLPAYTIFNGSIYYNTDNFRIGIKANNLTDKVYYVGWDTVNVQPFRAFLGTISYKF